MSTAGCRTLWPVPVLVPVERNGLGEHPRQFANVRLVVKIPRRGIEPRPTVSKTGVHPEHLQGKLLFDTCQSAKAEGQGFEP